MFGEEYPADKADVLLSARMVKRPTSLQHSYPLSLLVQLLAHRMVSTPIVIRKA